MAGFGERWAMGIWVDGVWWNFHQNIPDSLRIWMPGAGVKLPSEHWVDIFQLTRTVSLKQNYRSQKARLVHLETFPELWTWMD